ncbi:hypothetical protein, partial [Dokdonella sp.]|uniref:hypothetical protein n=1 Tax=Dokdonella sp. TaxID=2291710 RepID=UPI003783D85E
GNDLQTAQQAQAVLEIPFRVCTLQDLSQNQVAYGQGLYAEHSVELIRESVVDATQVVDPNA